MSILDPAATNIVDLIPLDAKSILDFGYASDERRIEYGRRNPMARVNEIELAGKFLHNSILDIETTELVHGEFDCIIFDEVLDSISDLSPVLDRIEPFLAVDGTLLIRARNPENWIAIEGRLRGTVDAGRDKISPQSGSNSLSPEAVRYALRKSGLQSIDTSVDIVDPDGAESFVAAMAPSLQALGVDRNAYFDRVAPSHYIWRVKRHGTGTRLHLVSTMLNPIGGVSHVRVRDPMQAVATDQSIITTVIGGADPPPEGVSGARVFIFHRPLIAGEAGLKRVQALISQGWIVVCEFDDHPEYIPVLRRPDVFNFSAVHAVQTSTEPLADVLRAYNPEIAVFPNALARMPDVRNYESQETVTLFFAGLNRELDWPPYLDALNAVAAKCGARLHFQILNDRGFYDMLHTPHKTFTPLCSYETYNDILAQCEISFMPLLDTPFNRCKSDLKFVEAAAHRVTALASAVVYESSIADGETGILFRNPGELEIHLTRLVASPEIGRSIGNSARNYARCNRMLAYQTSRRVNWYHSLWKRRIELNQSLLDRVPQLVPAG